MLNDHTDVVEKIIFNKFRCLWQKKIYRCENK